MNIEMFIRWGLAGVSVSGIAALMQLMWWRGHMQEWVRQNKQRRRSPGFRPFNGVQHFGYIFTHSMLIGAFSIFMAEGSVDSFVQAYLLLAIACLVVHLCFEARPPA